MNNIEFTIDKQKDVITITFTNLNELNVRPMMDSIDIIRNNLAYFYNGYVDIDQKSKDYINQINNQYNIEKEAESISFKVIRDLYLNYFNKYLGSYLSPTLYNDIDLLYKNEYKLKSFDLPKVPFIVHKINHTILYVKNIDELISQYGKPITLFLCQCLVNKAEYDVWVLLNKSIKYTLSDEIISKTFNEELNCHEHIKSFDNKQYVLTMAFNVGYSQLKTAEEILQAILIQEQLKT